MRCTSNKSIRFRRRRRRQNGRRMVFVMLSLIIFAGIFACVCSVVKERGYVLAYEKHYYANETKFHTLKADAFCVANQNVSNAAFQSAGEMDASGLFLVDDAEIAYAKEIHKRVYPASTTKLLTAYVAFKYGNLDDIVTVSENAVGVPLDSSRAGLYTGDQLSLKSLIYGLLLPSGNDCGVAIAEHISGSEAAFVELMNQEAALLGATNTHFTNSHGYHDDDHYTTAYDLYLIMHACASYDALMDILSSSSYSTQIDQKNGTYREVTWFQTNQYIIGLQDVPDGVTVVGGKTGTTDEAGACLVLYEKDDENRAYISIVMGAEDKIQLYNNMTDLLSVAAKQ